MSIISEIEGFFKPTQTTGEQIVSTTFRQVLQSKIAAAEAELAPVEAAYKVAVAKIEGAKADLSALEADFTAVLDKDVAEVETFFNRLASHFYKGALSNVSAAFTTSSVPPVIDGPAPAVSAPTPAPTNPATPAAPAAPIAS